jgi:hypothetical protein
MNFVQCQSCHGIVNTARTNASLNRKARAHCWRIVGVRGGVLSCRVVSWKRGEVRGGHRGDGGATDPIFFLRKPLDTHLRALGPACGYPCPVVRFWLVAIVQPPAYPLITCCTTATTRAQPMVLRCFFIDTGRCTCTRSFSSSRKCQ